MISQVELRAVSAVGLVYITRMLGLFMILPVLALNGDQYIGATTTTIGLALGIYGLMQALLQVPFGKLSDRIGRKPVILMGLALFAAGSILAALSESIQMLIFARAIQGAGAVSAALLALLSECSREQNRSKLMAILGISIGLSFGLAMVLGPVLAAKWGMQSIFWLCVVLAAIGAVAITGLTPSLSANISSSQGTADESEQHLLSSASNQNNRAELWRLNLGIFVLHAVQMSLWIAVPVILVENFEIAQSQHWKWYLLAVGGGFVCMAPLMQAFAKRNWYRSTLLVGIASLAVAQLLLSISDGFALFISGLLVFFWGFNLLEATLPSLVSRWVDDENRGSAMGWYSSSQFLGTFVGGSAGGILVSQYGLSAVFYFGFGLFIIWFTLATKMRSLPNIKSFVLKGLNAEATENLTKTVGIISIKNFQDQQEFFVKIDMDLVENQTLETYQLK
jgi:predicted MFS family arabinose efflux permease